MPAATLPRLKMCKDCDEIAISHDGRCRNHFQSNNRVRNYTDRPNPTKTMLNPFGVELEAINTCNRNSLFTVEPFVCYDASVAGDNGAEIKIIADSRKICDKSADTAQRARLAGGVVTTKCGFHVHMSMPKVMESYGGRPIFASLDSTNLQKLYPFLLGMQETFFNLVPNHRRDNEFCRAFSDNWYSLEDHHGWIARGARTPTLELRIHPGTLNPWKVKAWLEVCKGLQKIVHSVLKDDPSKDAIDAREGKFIQTFKKGTLARKYLDARMKGSGVLNKFGFNDSLTTRRA